jgi:hypothetical protein
MTMFTGTTFSDASFDSGLFDSALSDLTPGLAGNDVPTGDAGDRSVELAEHESATRPHADRAMLLHGDFSSVVDTDGKAGTDSVVEVEHVSGLKADSNEVAVEGLTGRDDDISLEPTRFESVARPHSDGVVLLHGDFDSLVDTDAAIAAATEELFGNYNFVRIEPTTSALESVRSMVDGHGKDANVVGFADGTSNTVVFAERHALSGAEGDGLLLGGGNGNETKVVGVVDGTSNTIGLATNNVVESLNVKYTFSNPEDDPVAGAARMANADYCGDGASLRDDDLLDVGDLLFGRAGDKSVTADGGDGFVESAASAGVTRPHADGVVTNNNDPETLGTVIDDTYDGTSSTFVDGTDRVAKNALASRAGGEVISADSYVIIDPTGTISDSGKDARLADITDGTSNTFALARTDVVNTNLLETMPDISDGGGGDARSVGVSDGLSNTLMIGERSAASNAIASDPSSEVDNSFVASLDMDTRNVVGTELQTLIGADRHARVDDLGMHYLQTDGAFLELGDLFVDFGADDRVSRDSRSYTFADGIEGDVSKDVASWPTGKESLNANIDNIDPFVGMVVLDVGDVLVGFDDGADNGNDSRQTRTADSGTPLPADSDGQANGIIAILIGLYTDTQGPLDSASLALD